MQVLFTHAADSCDGLVVCCLSYMRPNTARNTPFTATAVPNSTQALYKPAYTRIMCLLHCNITRGIGLS